MKPKGTHMQDAKTGSQDRAYAYIKERIANSTYQSNERLKPQGIASALGVSRTPVKEALGRLEQEGLVRRALGSGYVVHGLSVRDIINLYKVREALEVEAAREALAHITADDISALGARLERARELLAAERYDDFLRVNREFHDAITAITRNDVLQKVLASLSARFWSIGTIIVRKHPPRAKEILKENRRVLDALASGTQATVEDAVRSHVRGAARHVRAFIEQRPENLYIAA